MNSKLAQNWSKSFTHIEHRAGTAGREAQGGTPYDGLYGEPCQGYLVRLQVPVVQTLVSAIHGIKIYPVDRAIGFPNTYPLDSDLSGG